MKNKNIAPLVGLTVFLTACSAETVSTVDQTDQRGSSAEQQVEQRAKARWRDLVAEEWFAAYEYTTPAYKETTPIDVYSVHLRTTNVRWKSADFKGVECSSEQVCTTKFLVNYLVVQPSRGVSEVPGRTTVDEQWLKVEGEWYHVEE